VADAVCVAAAMALPRVTCGGTSGLWDFVSIAQPGDRRPQWEQRRKIAPGSHDTPNS